MSSKLFHKINHILSLKSNLQLKEADLELVASLMSSELRNNMLENLSSSTMDSFLDYFAYTFVGTDKWPKLVNRETYRFKEIVELIEFNGIFQIRQPSAVG